MEDGGVVERVVLPDTNDDIAKKAASRSVQARIGLGNANDRLAAARLVLTYTKPLPPTSCGDAKSACCRPAVQDGSIEFVRLPACLGHTSRCTRQPVCPLSTPDRLAGST